MEFAPIQKKHIDELVSNIRKADREEVQNMTMLPLYDAIELAVKSSEKSSVCLSRNKVICLMGIIRPTLLSNIGMPWFLTTYEIEKNKKALLYYPSLILKEMLTDFNKLVGYVDANYIQAINWLKWMGFKVSEPVEFGPKKKLFCQFSMEK